jgi:hypothetical protein
MIAEGIWLGALLPDADLKSKVWRHRELIFHSIIIYVGFLLLSLEFYAYALHIAIVILALGIHLLCDINIHTSGGTYCVHIGRFKTLDYGASTFWFIFNFIASIILLVITCIWVVS